jgi:glucose-1-phosphate cytidylyltransferase
MTGARIKRIERYVQGDEFMLTYGDGVADVKIDALLAFHRRAGTTGTVLGVRPPSRFGELVTKHDRVVEFSEKPQASSRFINGGFFVFKRRFFKYLSADEGCVFEREPLERLAKDGELVRYPHRGFWQCMDTPRDMRLLEHLWASGNPPWRVW